MTTQHQITGLGPRRPDGSMFIFTMQPAPFIANDAWIAEQGKSPAVGDILETNDKGAVKLVSAAQGAADAAAEEPDAAGAQKKSDGLPDSASGSKPFPFKQYAAKPIVVAAAEITGVDSNLITGTLITFADGSQATASEAMTARMTPVEGDYWVMAPQGDTTYEYLNPKAVFESKYTQLSNAVPLTKE